MLIAALSGMRAEEIAQLTVADCQDGVFNIRIAKTEAGRRKFPIHSLLASAIARRCAEKNDSAFLIDELKTPEASSKLERSMPVVKAFVTYRRALGVDETVKGVRQSRVEFHSFRRWFITKAEGAGIMGSIISAVVGHQRPGMTLGVYSGGPSLEQLSECVESVRLPLARS